MSGTFDGQCHPAIRGPRNLYAEFDYHQAQLIKVWREIGSPNMTTDNGEWIMAIISKVPKHE